MTSIEANTQCMSGLQDRLSASFWMSASDSVGVADVSIKLASLRRGQHPECC